MNFYKEYLCQKLPISLYMNKLAFFSVLAIIFSLSIIAVHESIAESIIPPRHQWKQTDNIDDLTCNNGLVLLQKNNGAPACVSTTAYIKLIDRGYGMYDSSLMMKRPAMMSALMKNMVSNDSIMMHWHDMMQNDPVMMKNTMNDWVSFMKNNTNYLENMMGPMTSDPKLRQKMIEQMKHHPQMESTLKQNPVWMDSVHQPMMSSDMHLGMDKSMQPGMCSWCPEYKMHDNSKSMMLEHSDKVMDMMHHMWINKEMAQDMHKFMLENPSHMAHMQDHMMGPMLRHMMDDPELREKMIEMMLQHQDFMNSIRHENSVN